MNILMHERRVPDFSIQGRRCMNCGREIYEASDLYSRRFCSVGCKDEYCSGSRARLEMIKKV